MFAKRLKECRESQGISQTKMADLVGVERTRYNKWESGKAEPKYAMLVNLAVALDVSIDYLLGLSDSKEITKKRVSIDGRSLEFHSSAESKLNPDSLTPDQVDAVRALIDDALEKRG